MRGEQGITVVELLVAISAGIAVLMGAFAMLNGTLRGSARTQQRVDANQRGRPVMTRIMDELHSVCVAPGIAPLYAGSDDDTAIFLHRTGNDVAPIPDKHVIDLTAGTITDAEYAPASGSVGPNYTFAGAATTTRLLTNVGQASIGGAPVPMFRYYQFQAGSLDPTPLPTPLSATNAAKTIQVTVSFAVSPSKTQVAESTTAVSLSDSALFRFTPAAEDATSVNLPCS